MNFLSFIIPAYNEEKFIANTIKSIHQYVCKHYAYEIIVIDHGSTDETVNLAIANNAKVYPKADAMTISELRNFGVNISNGDYLIFLDADTTLTDSWQKHIENVLNRINDNPSLIAGSKRIIPYDANWLSRSWFQTYESQFQPTHLGGGHMILSRSFFDKIGGFDIRLETGEDYEFCIRARQNGGTILSFPELEAIHHGVPSDLKTFFSREVWHGRGDSSNISTLFGSTVAITAIIFFLLHTGLIFGLFFFPHFSAPSLFILLSVAAICFVSSLRKSNNYSILLLLRNTFLYYVYYWARFISIISVIRDNTISKRSRHT